MSQRTLYAYVDGSDLDEIADELQLRLRHFVQSREWRHGPPTVINQRRVDDPTLGPDDLPDWELGLNYDLPDPTPETLRWFSDIEAISRFLVDLHGITGRDFVIGMGDRSLGIAEDLYTIDGRPLDLELLRRLIGISSRSP